MREVYKYRIYGMRVHSQICLPEAYAIDDMEVPDVYVSEGVMSDHIKAKIQEGWPSFWGTEEEAWFFTSRAGTYLIKQAKYITVERDTDADEGMVRAMLLGAALAHILAQRNIMAIHGSGVVKKQLAYIISGDSGAGKSTIVNECMKEADGFLADDTVVIDFREDGIRAVPAYPQQKLCEDTAIRAGYDITKLKRLGEECLKFAINRKEQFLTEPIEIGGMFVLKTGKNDKVIVEEIMGKQKLDILYANLYLNNLYKCIGVKPSYMKNTLEFIKRIPVYTVTRPEGKDSVVDVKEQIEAIMNSSEER